MRDQLAQIDDATLDQTDGFRPCVAVPVLELEVDFSCAQPHEWDLHLVLSNANDEHLAANLDSLDRAIDTRFDACALHCDRRFDTFHLLKNSVAEVIGCMRELNLVREDFWYKLL